jgi:hypothetical protein
MTEPGWVIRELRTQQDVIETMMASTSWDKRTRQQKMYILGRAKKLGLNVYLLRAKGWSCSEQAARNRLFTWLCAPEPTKEDEC